MSHSDRYSIGRLWVDGAPCGNSLLGWCWVDGALSGDSLLSRLWADGALSGDSLPSRLWVDGAPGGYRLLSRRDKISHTAMSSGVATLPVLFLAILSN